MPKNATIVGTIDYDNITDEDISKGSIELQAKNRNDSFEKTMEIKNHDLREGGTDDLNSE